MPTLTLPCAFQVQKIQEAILPAIWNQERTHRTDAPSRDSITCDACCILLGLHRTKNRHLNCFRTIVIEHGEAAMADRSAPKR